MRKGCHLFKRSFLLLARPLLLLLFLHLTTTTTTAFRLLPAQSWRLSSLLGPIEAPIQHVVTQSRFSESLYSYENTFRKVKDVQVRAEQKLKRPLFARVVAWILSRLVRKSTSSLNGLEMHVIADSNHDILRGKLDTIELKFDKVNYAQFFVSGGGRLIIKDLSLRMRRFLFKNAQAIRKPYTLYCDLLLTQQDIVKSTFIRNLIQLLVDTILERVIGGQNIVGISVEEVRIHSRRIHAKGVARLLPDTTTSGRPVSTVRREQREKGKVHSSNDEGLISLPFEVSTGIGVKEGGHHIFVKDIQVILNPDNKLLRAVVPLPQTAPIDIDLGAGFQIQSLVIANKNIWLRAASKISPVQPFQVVDFETTALYHYDLSALLSSVLRLNGGLISSRFSMRKN
mmetsp:Transcript_18367/g.30778  ORF Transcript_18367/g.30778 Transcript_18367/m.30778 type:complete len:398 (-) Transcript_18367:338-1531(-)